MQRRPPAPLLLLLAVVVLLTACGGEPARERALGPTPTFDPRPRVFELGLSSLPAELTDESYADAFALSAEAGDVVLIQRTPPWEEMLSGDLSDDTIEATERDVALAAEHGLDVFFAIDPFGVEGEGTGIVGLPERLRGAGFANEEVQRAFVAYAQYVAQNYHPAYLALGVEVNSYQQDHKEDFERFAVLYHEAYDAAKQLSPDTLIFPTFQLEELQGLLPVGDPRPPQWFLIPRFEPRLDLLAVSAFPSVAYADPQLIPDAYFAQLRSHSDRPLAITAMGYTSQPDGEGAQGGSEQEQAAFLQRALDNAQALSMRLVVWFVGQDPTFAGDDAFDPFRHTGLLAADGSPKEAWSLWRGTAARPLQPPSTSSR